MLRRAAELKMLSVLRCTAKQKRYRWAGAVLPGEIGRRPFLWLIVHFPKSARYSDQGLSVRWPGVLAGTEAVIQRAIPLVAGRGGRCQTAGSLRGTRSEERRVG